MIRAVIIFLSLIVSSVYAQNTSVHVSYEDLCHLVKTHQTEEADFQIEKQLRDDSNNARLYNLKALNIIHSGPINDLKNDKAALTFMNKAISINPNEAGFYANRGWVYQFMNNYKMAKKDFDEAAHLEPNNIKFRGHQLRILWIMKRKKEALSMATNLIKEFPNNGYAYHVRGHLKRDYLHKYIEGNKDLKKAKELGWASGIHFVY